MDVFSVITMVGGLALFLYGMNQMGDGLAKLAGGKLERILERLTSKKIYGLLLGAIVTAIIQSSSATTVMVVGFVNSGIMQLSQAVGIIIGANIGTTATSWLISLTGISGDSVLLKLLKPSSFSPILACIGIILIMTAKNNAKKKDIGNIMVSFAVLMFGMETMSDAVAPLADNSSFTSILTAFSFPVLGMLVGAIFTAIIQSSSASVGILQALCLTGALNYSTIIPIIMGQNIGTCITSILSSIGANKNAKRASMVHLYFNLIGTIIFMVVFYSLNAAFHFEFLDTTASVVSVAVIHSLFNVGCAALLYPFTDLLVKLAKITIPGNDDDMSEETDGDSDKIRLDDRFLERPAFAMEICRNTTRRMADEVNEAIGMALELLTDYDGKKAAQVLKYEQRVDEYEDVLGSYMVKLSSHNLSAEDSRTMSVLLHSISDLERISDHALNIKECALDIYDNKKEFSEQAKEELAVMVKAVRDIVSKTVSVFKEDNIEEAVKIEPLEDVIDRLNKEIKQRHVKRLTQGKCTIELGLSLENLLINLERVSDHCSNIAVALIEIKEDVFDTHAYLENISKDEGSRFNDEVKRYESIYRLPKANTAG